MAVEQVEQAAQIESDVTKMRETQHSYAPMKGIPPIPRNMTPTESNAKRLDWQPPKILPGEIVFWRRFGSGEEVVAIAHGTKNKTWTLTVMNVGIKEGVCYYDHMGDPAKNDPKACHSAPGTFRRTVFGQVVEKLLAGQGTVPDNVSMIEGLKAQVEALRAEVGRMISKATGKGKE